MREGSCRRTGVKESLSTRRGLAIWSAGAICAALILSDTSGGGMAASRATRPMRLSRKYVVMRRRFLRDFYFAGRVASEIDRNVPGGRIVFADQTIYMGQALMIFSTEMRIRREARLPVKDTRAVVKELLDGIEALELKANRRYHVANVEERRGLIVRDDIEGSSDSRLRNRFREVRSDWQSPEKENASPSGDQLFGLMLGLYCVKHYSGDAALVQQAEAIADRLFEYARKTHFELELPNGNKTRRGSDMRWLASLYHGLAKSVSGKDRFDKSRVCVDVLGRRVTVPLRGIAAFWDDSATPNALAQLVGKRLSVPAVGEISLNSFALHIVLTAVAPSEVWTLSELEHVAIPANHHLAVLIYSVAHGKRPTAFGENDIDRMLASCPESGPRAGRSADSGWQHDNRWIRCTKVNETTSGTAEYNGLDWMVLHNFRELAFHGAHGN